MGAKLNRLLHDVPTPESAIEPDLTCLVRASYGLSNREQRSHRPKQTIRPMGGIGRHLLILLWMMGAHFIPHPMAKLLITGGAGFIGSHTALVLLEAGHELLVFDDFSNSTPIALDRVREIAGPEAAPWLRQIHVDIRNSGDLEQALCSYRITN